MWRRRFRKKCPDCPAGPDKDCVRNDITRLSNYRPGQKGAIVQICGAPDFRLRIMEMGFVKGTEVEVVKYAPLQDPIEFIIKGYHITLRREQAKDILMSIPDKAA